MTHSIPKAHDGYLQQLATQGIPLDSITIGTEAWFNWLEQHHSFSFETGNLRFTARKEQRPGGWYWYAYRRSQGRLHSVYLGRSEELTLERLNTTAQALKRAGEALENETHQTHGEIGGMAKQLDKPEPILAYALPTPLTPLIGREREMASVMALLRKPEVRLLTLCGAAGIGKTRLAIQVATDLREDFADGAAFVSLAPLRDAELVHATIAHALGLTDPGHEPQASRLRTFLQHKHLLLVLDNFEQVIDAASSLMDLLAACPYLKLLVTSREVLHLRAEQQFTVPPLALPDLTHLPDSTVVAQYAAVKLFIQRAQAVKHDFAITSTNVRPIAEICTRLDGLPLALELAAARIRLLSPAALLSRLDRRFEILTGGANDLPERQRTLRATLVWSYELLSARERRLLRRLAVFVGGCMLSAVEALWRTLDQAESSVLDAITSLMDKSLVYQREDVGGEPRLLMLETVREYAWEALATDEEMEAVRHAHAAYYLALAEEAESHLISHELPTWLHRLEQELDNLRAAFAWFLASQQYNLALQLHNALWLFWLHMHISEGQRWDEQFLTACAATSSLLDGKAKAEFFYYAAMRAYFTRNIARADELAEEGLRFARLLGDKAVIALVLNVKAQCALDQGEYALVDALTQESLPIFKELGNAWRVAEALFYTAYAFCLRGDYVKARLLGEEGLVLCQEVGEPATIVRTLQALAYFAYAQHDYVTAWQRFAEGLLPSQALNSRQLLSSCLIGLGVVAQAQGQLDWAAQLWGAAAQATKSSSAPESNIYQWQNEFVRHQFDYERLVARTRTELGEESFIVAWDEGQTLTVEQLLQMQSLPTKAQQNTRLVGSSQHPSGLTARELEVLRLIAQGLTDAQVANRLIISVRTVQGHLRSIYNKLNVASRSAATRYALEHKLV
jgi:predicted ATPase/DNA-binding CsgD family transcriptional regulator